MASCDIPSRDDSNQVLMVKPQLRSLHKGSSIKVGNTGEEERDKERFRVETGPSNVRRNHIIHSFEAKKDYKKDYKECLSDS